MLKLTAKQLLDSFPAMSLLANQKLANGNQRLAYNLGKTWRAIRTEAEEIGKQEAEIYKSFGATEAEGGRLVIDFEKLSEAQRKDFDDQLQELRAVEIEVWGHPLTLAEIEKANINLSAQEFDLLCWLIVEEQPAAEPATQAAAA